jgi:hypothetical protein
LTLENPSQFDLQKDFLHFPQNALLNSLLFNPSLKVTLSCKSKTSKFQAELNKRPTKLRSPTNRSFPGGLYTLIAQPNQGYLFIIIKFSSKNG